MRNVRKCTRFKCYLLAGSGGWGSDAIEEVTSVDEGDYVRLAESNWPDVVGEFKYLWFTRGESIESLLKANDRIFIDKTGCES